MFSALDTQPKTLASSPDERFCVALISYTRTSRETKKNFPQLNQSEKCQARKTGRILGQNVHTGSSKHNTMKPRQSNQQERASTNRPSSPGYRRDVNNQDCDNSKSPFQPSIQCCLYKQCKSQACNKKLSSRTRSHSNCDARSIVAAFVYDSSMSSSSRHRLLQHLRLRLDALRGNVHNSRVLKVCWDCREHVSGAECNLLPRVKLPTGTHATHANLQVSKSKEDIFASVHPQHISQNAPHCTHLQTLLQNMMIHFAWQAATAEW